MKILFPLVAVLSVCAIASSVAQQPAAVNSEFKIDSVVPNLQVSPGFSGVQYDKRGSKPKSWLEIEVTFEWAPRLKEPLFTDEVTVNYYILLNTPPSKTSPKGGTLLTGTVALQNIPQGKGMHTVAYVSPRTLEKLFEGKAPTNAQAAVKDVGVTLSAGGGVVAELSWKGRGQWWPQFQGVSGYVRGKSDTPFAPLVSDYFEDEKAKSSAQ
jgi:hypothetical protein